MKQRVLSLVVAIFATTSLWAYDFKMGDLYYTITHTSEPYTVEVTRNDNYSNLTTVSIPNTVTFNGITFSVTSIESSVFMDCKSLTSITIPSSVTSIGDWAFTRCINLTSIIVESTNAKYDSRDGCNAIIETATNTLIQGCKTTTIPPGVTNIERNAFMNCKSLTSITIPNSVKSIGDHAFYMCTGLDSITIPNSVKSIGDYAFNGCGRTSIIVESDNTKYDSRDNCNAIIKTSTNTLIQGCKTTIIPNSVTSIGDRAFYGTSLNSITIPNSVKSIGDHAFYCTGIDSITIPNSVIIIGNFAFCLCRRLTSVVIPNSVTSIGNCAFAQDTGITSITIPNSVKSIGYSAFENCVSLTSITIPDSITKIRNSTFRGCTGLTSITIPNSVTSIESYAFVNCTGLHKLIMRTLEKPSVDKYPFMNTSIDSVYVPCGTKDAYIGWSGFSADKFVEMCDEVPQYIVSVVSEDIRKGSVNDNYTGNNNEWAISAIANSRYQFSHWSDGKTDNPRVLTVTQDTTLIAYFVQATSGQCGDNLYWSYADDTLSITGTGDMYDYAADSANAAPWVLLRDSISEVVLPEGITYIGTHAFRQLPLLTEVTIPNAVEEIGESAFAGCAGLGKVVIGSGNSSRLTTMGNSVFIDSRKLYEIHIAATEPPIADRTTFLNYNVHLYVPCESKDKYDLDMVFGDFKYIECLDTDTPVEDFAVTPAQTSAKFVWGAPSNAATYTLDLQQEDAPFFTLVFNATGQLQSISLAPIGSQVRLTAAEKAGNGFTFNATGLTARTLYNYDLTIRDAAEVTLQNYSGYFYTTSDIPTGTEDSAADDTTPRKVFRDGQVYILRGGKTYTVMGQEISDLSNLSRGEAQ